MARDKIVAAVIAAFGKELGGRRALVSTWSRLAQIASNYHPCRGCRIALIARVN